MQPGRRPPSSLAIVLVGLAALASAMGVGRFAFTPLLPLMQTHGDLSLGQGAWLAGANYLGYALGALACSVAPPAPEAAARFGLVGVAVSTLAMGATGSYEAWLLLRLVAGVASACVLVGVSAWAIASLAERGRAAWSGGVFSGVGTGIAVAGAAGLVAALDGDAPARVWLALGAMSSAVAALAWLPLRAGAANATAAARSPQRPPEANGG
jgi:MFS family permease